MPNNLQGASALACPFSLLNLLNDSPLACIEIGLAEIEAAAGVNVSQIYFGELTESTEQALRKRPEHAADILLVSSWMFAEVLCTDTQRDVVRQHYLTIARLIEYGQS